MKNRIKYKGFIGSIQYSDEDSTFFGRIDGIDSLITFEGTSVSKLKKAFEDAVDDYLKICADLGKEPKKSFTGSFNIRIKPNLHIKLSEDSKRRGISMNKLIQETLEKEFGDK
jgi:predicted HicB family RNase H-like nuclease